MTLQRILRFLGWMAILFGIATLISGGRAIVEMHGITHPTANIVPFVLFFNLAAGVPYIVTGAGLILQRPWAAKSAAAIALATFAVFVGLGAWILVGNAYDIQTVLAMTLRTAFWSTAGVLAALRS